jgi:hypothetical protein
MFEPLTGAVVDCFESLVVAATAVILVETSEVPWHFWIRDPFGVL